MKAMNRTSKEKFFLLVRRIISLVVTSIYIFGASYALILVFDKQEEIFKWIENKLVKYPQVANIAIFAPSAIIIVLNFVTPILMKLLVKFESYDFPEE